MFCYCSAAYPLVSRLPHFAPAIVLWVVVVLKCLISLCTIQGYFNSENFNSEAAVSSIWTNIRATEIKLILIYCFYLSDRDVHQGEINSYISGQVEENCSQF